LTSTSICALQPSLGYQWFTLAYNRVFVSANVQATNLGGQLLQQRLRVLQIARIEPFSEPAVDRSKQFARLLHLALGTPEAGEAHGGRRLLVKPSLTFTFLGKQRVFAESALRAWVAIPDA